MDIQDYLSLDCVSVGERLTQKRRLFEVLSSAAGDALGIEHTALLEKILERERIGSTYLGNGCACPHIAFPPQALQEISPQSSRAFQKKAFGFLMILDQPIDYDPPYRQEVDIVFMLLGFDKEKARQALQLTQFRLNSPWIRTELRKAKNRINAYNIITGPIRPCPTQNKDAYEETDLEDLVPEFSTSLLS